MAEPLTTVFGGSGFLGRRVVRRLLEDGKPVRVASRHPERAAELFGQAPLLQSLGADINKPEEVAWAVADAAAVVNAVSLYAERDGATFHSVHVVAAGRLARLAREAGVQRLVQLSGVGADPRSDSPYIRSRGEGEAAVLEAFPAATVVRPTVMFGEDDVLVAPLAALLRRLPVFALFGSGKTRLQPTYVDDVAAAVVRTTETPQPLLELGGPEIMTYRALVERIASWIGRRPVLLPLPFAAWQRLAWLAEQLPVPLITRNQVELMRFDNVVSRQAAGFPKLGIAPRSLGALLPQILPKRGAGVRPG